jgi:hypothetical protein
LQSQGISSMILASVADLTAGVAVKAVKKEE